LRVSIGMLFLKVIWQLYSMSIFLNTRPCNDVGGCTHATTKFDRYGFTTPNAHLHCGLYNYARGAVIQHDVSKLTVITINVSRSKIRSKCLHLIILLRLSSFTSMSIIDF